MGWWVSGAAALLLLVAYLIWLAARVGRLHRRAAAAAAALDASLARRAAAAATVADELAGEAPEAAAGLSAAARAALEAGPPEREAAENDLTQVLHRLPRQVPRPVPSWESVVTASRRVGLARQVHTDVVRDALAVRRRVPVRVLGLARRHPQPAYFDVGDPELNGTGDWAGVSGAEEPGVTVKRRLTDGAAGEPTAR